MWLMRWQDGEDVALLAELIIQTINITAGRLVSVELLAHPQYQRLSTVTNNLCIELFKFHKSKENGNTHCDNGTMNTTIDSKMQELVQLVLSDSPHDDLDRDVKHTFLTVAKTFYYKAYFDPKTINVHISKAMFEVVT
ncbi:putative ent-copalyl diphosphate synthase [Helianthus anomalus]